MTDRITAAQEFAWLTDRAEHRKPIDAFFDGAIETILANSQAGVLELGPGPLTDIRDRLTGIMYYVAADTRPARVGVTAMEPLWSAERRLPYKDAAFTDVLAREVFEHVFDLREMIEEAWRVLAPGGCLWFSTPFAFPLHDYEDELGGDFWRLSPRGWVRLLTDTGFMDVSVISKRELFSSWQMPVSILGAARK